MASDTRKTTAKRKPKPKSHPLSPSRYKAIKNAPNTKREPTSGIARTTTAGIAIIARAVHSDFLFFILKSGPAT